MGQKEVEIAIFGAEQICASCVNLPSSIDTYEWLQAAISRKFPNQPFRFTYTDIFQPPDDEEKKRFAQKVIDEDLFYPVILVEGKIVGEGNARLKTIYAELEKYGYIPEEK
ncbi:YuzD family protein [Niallia sp. Krafla_26]|uniref:YuzD family protein n=1 Tax=Niallia sp. Krafla_26 TaxID=3064703 RepID=UPI003D178794